MGNLVSDCVSRFLFIAASSSLLVANSETTSPLEGGHSLAGIILDSMVNRIASSAQFLFAIAASHHRSAAHHVVKLVVLHDIERHGDPLRPPG